MAAIENINDRRIPVEHDLRLAIALGDNRFEKQWRNTSMSWSVLLWRLSNSYETRETHAAYMRMKKDQQDAIKDIGGFVGGHLKDGKRRNGNVACRQIVTLDIDFPPNGLWEQLVNELRPTFAMCMYSTHKYTPQSPRYRLVIPLDREVSAEEYEAISRQVAGKIGIDYFDDSTFQPTRLMYWPSCSKDVTPFFRYADAPILCADSVLAEYPDWTDVSYWPYSSRVSTTMRRLAEKQEDPLSKPGIIGAFCRTYTIQDAILEFLPDVYEMTAREDRYTYSAGSTAAGLVIYGGGIFAYSNHSTDPAGGQLCNAFDLVRIHLFGGLDDEVAEEKRLKGGSSLPSFRAMQDFAAKDEKTKRTLAQEREKQAQEDFADLAIDDDPNWREKLDLDKAGHILPTIKSAGLILLRDEELQGIAFNELSGAVEALQELPWEKPDKYWHDSDDAQLFYHVSIKYGVHFSERIFHNAFVKVTTDRRFNPLREYMEDLPAWDGVQRVDTLLVDYLGAEDSDYVRAVTRKTLVGAVMRVYHPGCKFDTVLVLDGKPGIGKSTLLSKLGGEWFSDSLNLADTKDKTAAEKLQGCWIMEIGEMQGMRKADVDNMKGFLSRQVDEYRAAYGRNVEKHPRVTIICGTTNSTNGFLRDTTGNRRFWPVIVSGDGVKNVWGITEDIRAQLWSETREMYRNGETAYLSSELEKEAALRQQESMERDEREGEVTQYLDTLLPEDWYSWSLEKRVEFFQQHDELAPQYECTIRRDRVCAREIFCECFGRPKNSWKKQDGYDIAGIMARLPGWIAEGRYLRDKVYGHQRAYSRQDL